MAPVVYTSLESLALIQAILSCKEKPVSFARISDTLRTNELLQNDESLNLDHLEPEQLKLHYFSLLKQEIKAEQLLVQSPQKDASSPRKRKRSSPPLDSVDDALQYAHLLPQLLSRLQLEYNDYAIKLIQEEEQRYLTLARELQEIERGEWNERLQQQGPTSRRGSRGVSSIENLLRHDEEEDRVQPASQPRPTSSHDMSNGIDKQALAEIPKSLLTRQENAQVSQEPQRVSQSEQKQTRPVGPAETSVPFRPPQQPLNQGYPLGSPNSDIHRRLPPPSQLQAHPLPSASPLSAHNALPPQERSSASPIILPPPKGMLRPSGSPGGPLDPLTDITGPQQYRGSPAMSSPRTRQQPGSQQHPHPLPQPGQFAPPPYPYYDNQSRFQAPYSPHVHGPYHHGNYQHPPYQSPVVTPGQGSPYSNIPHFQSPTTHYPPQHSIYSQSPTYYQQPPVPAAYPRGQVPRFSDQHTPLSNVSSRHRAFKLSPIHTSASSTKWKNVDTSGSIRQRSPSRPNERDISPISDKAPSPSPPPEDLERGKGNIELQNRKAVNDPRDGILRGRLGRGRGSKRGRGGRAASAAFSMPGDTPQTRTRSQSIASQADELSIDQPPSTRRIKPEPSGISLHDDDESVASPTADESGRKPSHNRRGTFRSLEGSDSSRPTSKLAVDESSIIPPPSPAMSEDSRPGFVLGTRNFPRISATLMNTIIHHKVANLFAKPLTEREAPGYKDLIYRPQDLKSIKNAIGAGSRALAVAAENAEEPKDLPSVWVPESPEVIPPKGIVNSAQLEKELMRMFANAIMFNPDISSNRGVGPAFRTRQKTKETRITEEEDEDQSAEETVKGKEDVSVVKDTREMFRTVQHNVAEWMGAERTAKLRGGGSEEMDELAGTGEEIVGSVEQDATPEPRGKRKKR